MTRPKSFILPLSVDQALKRHTCQNNSKHVIAKGDTRLKVAVGRSHEHYCVKCAKKFIDQAIERMQEIVAQFETS